MGDTRRSSRRAWRLRAATLGVAAGLAGLGLVGGSAGAASRTPLMRERPSHGAVTRTTAAARHKRRRSKMPVVRNATNLAVEPVVHATKGKPPKKLRVKNLVLGTGATVTATSTVSVVYVGANYKTGKDFTQATWTTHKAITFPLSGVVPGFAEGLIGMKVGGRREIVIPPKLGYRNQHRGPIKPDETLVFVVDLKGVSG